MLRDPLEYVMFGFAFRKIKLDVVDIPDVFAIKYPLQLMLAATKS